MRRNRAPAGHSGRDRGLTLVESMMALAVLSFAVLAVNFAVVAGQTHARAGDSSIRAIELAQDLLEEILALPYDDPDGASTLGPEAAETSRLSFDNADDFHGYSESPGSITDFTGNAYPGDAQAFTRSVAIATSNEFVTDLSTAIAGLTVTITVMDDQGRSWAITHYIPEAAP